MQMQGGEKLLLEKLITHDQSAFSELYTLYIRKIYAYALGIVKSPDLAEDVAQETFVKLWELAPSIESERQLGPYLFTIARNHALNILKRASRESSISEEIFSNAIHQSENGLQYTQRKQTGQLIRMAISQLPPKRRQIYEMCRDEGYSYKEAAKVLGISDNTVNSQMVKAIKAIKDFMDRHGALLLSLFLFAINKDLFH